MKTKNKPFYAFFAGMCASIASLFGKLSGSSILMDFLLLRIVCLVLMILCNAGVWTLFAKALQVSKSSLSATIISTASNYLVSMITGFLVFHETTSLLWWSGLAFMLFGIILITSDEHLDAKHTNVKKSE